MMFVIEISFNLIEVSSSSFGIHLGFVSSIIITLSDDKSFINNIEF